MSLGRPSALGRWVGRRMERQAAVKVAGVLVFFILALGLASFLFTRHLVLGHLRGEAALDALVLAQRLEAALNHLTAETQGLAKNPLVRGALADPGERRALLAPYVAGFKSSELPEVRLAVVDAGGQVVAANHGRAEYQAQAWRQALEAGRPQADILKLPEGLSLRYLWPVVHPVTGLPEGLVLMETDLSFLLARAGLSQGEHARGLWGQAQGYLYGNQAVSAGDLTVERALDLQGPLASAGLRVVVARGQEQALAPVRSILVMHGVAALLAVAVAVYLSILASRRLMAPIVALGEIARQVGRTDRLDTAARPDMAVPTGRQDEVGDLARAFASMLEKLSRKQEELEEAVRARTREVRESEEAFRVTFENGPIGMAILSPDMRYLRANRAYCELTGYGAEELARMSAWQVVHPDDQERSRADAGDMLAGRLQCSRMEKRYRRQDGSTLWVRVTMSLARDQQGEPLFFLPHVEDITRVKRAEHERLLYQQRQNALLEMSHMSEASQEELCGYALEAGVRLTESQFGYLYFYDEESGELCVHSWSAKALQLCQVPGSPGSYRLADTGLWGEAVRQRRPVVTNDYQADNPLKRGLPLGHVPLTRHMNVPVMEGGRVVAVAGVANKEGAYDEGDVRLLQLIMDSLWGLLRRREALEALRGSEELFRQMFESNLAVKLLINPADGAIVRANQAACQFYGYTPQQFEGMRISDINTLPHGRLLREMEKACLNDTNRFEFQHRLASGEVRQVEVYSSLLTMGQERLLYSLVHDITQRKQAEEALRRAGDYNRSLIEASLDPLVTIDPQGKITDVNAATERVTGHSRHELVGTDFSAYFSDPERARQGYKKVFAEGRVLDYELELRHRQGWVTPVLYNASVYRDPQGQVQGVFAAARDISELKQAQSAIMASLSEKEVLLREIHHRVKNNLQVVASLLSLRAGQLDDPKVSQVLRESEDRVRAMAMIHEALYRSQSLAAIDLGSYLGDMARHLQGVFGERGGVRLVVEAQPLQMGVDQAVACGLIINELVTNAFKYAFPAGGQGEVRVEARLSSRDEVELSVRDNGVGLPQGLDLARSRTLGLQLVRGLVEHQLGGTWDYSGDRGGTVFNIRWPLHEGGKDLPHD